MQITIEKTDTEIIEAICGRLNYEPMLKNEDENGEIIETPNPESDVDFVTRKVYEYVKNEIEAYFGNKLRTEAQPAEKVIVDEKTAPLDASIETISKPLIK